MLGTECLSIWYLATNIQVTPAIPGVCVELTSGVCVVRALRVRKGLGGGWRKPGPLAAAALVAMEDAAERFKKDHEHAKTFAKGCM